MEENRENFAPEIEQEKYFDYYDIKLRDTMIADARGARNSDARNHRGFFVGCSVSTIIKADYETVEAKTFSAGNYTPEKKEKLPEAKWCAERIAINLALKAKGVFIPAIVTVSKEVDRGEGGVVHDVLHQCPECQGLLQHCLDEGFMSKGTKICNVNDSDPDNLIIREMTLEQLLSGSQNRPKS